MTVAQPVVLKWQSCNL